MSVKQLVESIKHMDPMDIFDVLMGRTNDNVVDRLDIEYCSLEGRLVRDLQQNEMSDCDIETVIQCLRDNIYLEDAESNPALFPGMTPEELALYKVAE